MLVSLLTSSSIHGAYPDDRDVTDRICFVDLTDSNAPWAGCWNVPADLSAMLYAALNASPNCSLHQLSPDNVKLELLVYRTLPFEKGPKTALFPADAHRCLNVLHIKARIKIVSCTGEMIYNETIASDHVLDEDGLQYDYCRYHNCSMGYSETPLAHAHGDFIRDVLARLDRLQQRGLL